MARRKLGKITWKMKNKMSYQSTQFSFRCETYCGARSGVRFRYYVNHKKAEDIAGFSLIGVGTQVGPFYGRAFGVDIGFFNMPYLSNADRTTTSVVKVRNCNAFTVEASVYSYFNSTTSRRIVKHAWLCWRPKSTAKYLYVKKCYVLSTSCKLQRTPLTPYSRAASSGLSLTPWSDSLRRPDATESVLTASGQAVLRRAAATPGQAYEITGEGR